MRLPKYTIGVGDRFAHEGVAQLDAVLHARELGVRVAPVWNKSYREHQIVGTRPADVRAEADAAAQVRHYDGSYFVDADHITLATVDEFIPSSNFFTLDVADVIGERADTDAIKQFVARCEKYTGELTVPGIDQPLVITRDSLRATAEKYLVAVQEAGRIYRHIAEQKGEGLFVTEVSMDETDQPQTPDEMLLILAAIAEEKIPAATIAPRFSGRFNKGVDYVGDVDQFAREFEQDVAVIAFAVEEFGLPEKLKLSVHSGSDKFSLYPVIRETLKKFDAGVHLKTAGTTWLEELIGLAEAGGDALTIAKRIYRAALGRFDELCKPYATVIDIDPAGLPSADAVDSYSGAQFAAALRHNPSNPSYNPNLRQLLHVGYKVAAEMGDEYLKAIVDHHEVVARNVTENLLDRHLRPLLIDSA
jgi:hypothetical protein